MSLPVKIKDGGGSNQEARVSDFGALAVGALKFSEAYNATLNVDNTVRNVIAPNQKDNFIITGMYLKGDRLINNTTDANFTLYESSGGPASTTQTKVILDIPIGQRESVALTGLNLIVSQGVWLNAIATDSTITVTIFGYYVKPLSLD